MNRKEIINSIFCRLSHLLLKSVCSYRLLLTFSPFFLSFFLSFTLAASGQEDLVQFLAEHKVRVVASLPCYSEKNVNMQRGQGVFGRSISGLQALNAAGYGKEGSELGLDLVFNPLKGVLPPGE